MAVVVYPIHEPAFAMHRTGLRRKIAVQVLTPHDRCPDPRPCGRPGAREDATGTRRGDAGVPVTVKA
jgi:hypothetical protein